MRGCLSSEVLRLSNFFSSKIRKNKLCQLRVNAKRACTGKRSFFPCISFVTEAFSHIIMKTCLLLVFLMMAGSEGLFAQSSFEQAFVLDSLPPNGIIILDKGW